MGLLTHLHTHGQALDIDSGSSVLDGRIAAAGVTREHANTATMRHYTGAWERDILYQYGGEGGPRYKHAAVRLWIEAATLPRRLLLRMGWL
jgi:hypothetical protein